MKILQINKFHYLRGGSERHVFELSELLEKKGHQVFHFSMQDKKNIKSSFAKYFITPVDLHKFSIKNIIKYFYNYEAVKNLKKLIKENQIDLAHIHNVDGQISPAILRVLKKNNIPVVQTLHDYKLLCPNAKFFRQGEICQACKGDKFYHCFLKKCVHDSRAKSLLATLESYLNKTVLKSQNYIDMFIAPSNFMKDKCVSFGISAEKINVINNFLSEKQRSAVKNLAEESYVLYFGRLAEEKGVTVLIDAMTKIKSDVKLKIAGVGSELENLKRKVRNLGMEEQVDFVGFKNSRDLDVLVAKAKAVVMPSIWYENMPYSLIESLSAGKVSIVSKTGGMQELVEDGVNGLLFKRGDSDDLTGKIDSLTKIDVVSIKNNAIKSAEKFNGEIFYKKLMVVYRKI